MTIFTCLRNNNTANLKSINFCLMGCMQKLCPWQFMGTVNAWDKKALNMLHDNLIIWRLTFFACLKSSSPTVLEFASQTYRSNVSIPTGLGRAKDKVVSPCTSCVLPSEHGTLETSSSQQKAKRTIASVGHNLQRDLHFLQV